MSALRNAVKRKTHKERSQPGERRKFGLLEKKKDYVLRARDFHKKEDAIKVLKTKAAYKNPDEFYFGMERSRTRDGVHVGRADESNKYTAEELALMKTQDVKYVGLKASVEAKKAEKLRANLHLIGEDESHDEDDLYDSDGFLRPAPVRTKKRHVFFVDDEKAARGFDAAQRGGGGGKQRRGETEGVDAEAAVLAEQKRRRMERASAARLGLRREAVFAADEEGEAEAGVAIDPRLEKRLAKKRKVAYKLLKEREQRAARLRDMTAEMAMRKEISHARGHKRKVGKGGGDGEDVLPGLRHLQKAPPQFKWKKERKR
jgi:U3 small nucleolar RNA-associated protein 11